MKVADYLNKGMGYVLERLPLFDLGLSRVGAQQNIAYFMVPMAVATPAIIQGNNGVMDRSNRATPSDSFWEQLSPHERAYVLLRMAGLVDYNHQSGSIVGRIYNNIPSFTHNNVKQQII